MGDVIFLHERGKGMDNNQKVKSEGESIFEVAAYLLSKESMTNKKLQKLCFYVQSWYYAFEDKLLFSENFEAWVHGPVCPILYRAYKQWGSLNIPRFTNVDFLRLKERTRQIIDAVYEAYGRFTGDQLEACTHVEMPWIKARAGCRPEEYCRNVISVEDMRDVCVQKMGRV